MTRLLSLIAVAVCVSSAWGQTAGESGTTAQPPATRPNDADAKAGTPPKAPGGAERDIVRILRGRVPEVVFDHTPLETVMEWVQDYTGVMVYVRYAVLEEQGIGRETPISLKVKGAALKQILWGIMNEAAGASGVTLAYQASSELIVLSTEQDLGEQMISRVYDCKEIHVDVPYFWREGGDGVGVATVEGSEGKIFRTRVRRAKRPSGSLGGGDLFGPLDAGAAPVLEVKSEEEQLQEFTELILNAVEPESWAINGLGGKGTIFPYKGRLIIRNSLRVHRILAGEKKP